MLLPRGCESCQMSYIPNHAVIFLPKPSSPLTQCSPSPRGWSLELEALTHPRDLFPYPQWRISWQLLLSHLTDTSSDPTVLMVT